MSSPFVSLAESRPFRPGRRYETRIRFTTAVLEQRKNLFRLRYGYAWLRLHVGLKRARDRRHAGRLPEECRRAVPFLVSSTFPVEKAFPVPSDNNQNNL